jgi:hypothetical protein
MAIHPKTATTSPPIIAAPIEVLATRLTVLIVDEHAQGRLTMANGCLQAS